MDAKKEYLRDMVKIRGFIMDHHKVLAAEDEAFLRALNDFVAIAQTRQRTMKPKIKEFAMLAALVAVGSAKNHIKAHIEVAKREGASKEEVLELLELLVPLLGMPRFMLGYEAWKECFEVERVEPD